MNKKGFAISVILYVIVFLIIAIFYILLGIVKSRYSVNTGLKDSVESSLNGLNHLYSKLEYDGPASLLLIDPNGGKVTFDGVTTREIVEVIRYGGDSVSVPVASDKPNSTNGTYNLTYVSDGGDTTPAASRIPITIAYDFVTWDPIGDCDTYAGGAYTFPDDAEKTCTLKASWHNTVVPTTITLADNITKDYHIFAGWKSDANGQVYEGGTTYEMLRDTVMTAQWTVNVWTDYIKYDNPALGCSDIQCAVDELNRRLQQ